MVIIIKWGRLQRGQSSHLQPRPLVLYELGGERYLVSGQWRQADTRSLPGLPWGRRGTTAVPPESLPVCRWAVAGPRVRLHVPARSGEGQLPACEARGT